MRIFEGHNENGDLIWFEISNIFCTRHAAIKIVRKIYGVEVLEIQLNDDMFCKFRLRDRVFDLWEPFGDNSRYHIGEKEAKNSEELETIRDTFSPHKQWPLSLFSR